jgi:hypothetical protein
VPCRATGRRPNSASRWPTRSAARALAERLLAALIDGARAAGLRWLVGEVLAGNARMLAFMRRCGFAATTRGGLEPGLVRVERSVDRALPVAQAAGS